MSSAGRKDHIAVPVGGGTDPLISALRASAAATAVAAMRASTGTAVMDRDPDPGEAPSPEIVEPRGLGIVGSATGPAGSADGASADGLANAAADGTAPGADERCADRRHLADERCELASRSRAGALDAEERLKAGRLAYDEHVARAEAAEAAGDPRAVRAAKDAAQERFRVARGGAITTDEVEAAARDWLTEINQINAEARDAAAAATRERDAVRESGLELERLMVEADTARIAAETAEAACLEARIALADCEEEAKSPPEARPLPPPTGSDEGADEERVAAALMAGGTPRVFRLVRGDRSAMIELVAAMAGDDIVKRRDWQLALSDLVDAILAESIAAISLDFPEDHPFWGPFTIAQDRDIARALSSLGYRFDGLGGWVDGRIPSQRDLSLALGYAGIDPMRIRQWPTDAETRALWADVAVAADERLAAAAGDLTLGELVTLLGRRADGLAEVWNHWGTLRPLLLETT